VIQTLGLIIVALIGSGFAYLAARRSGRAEKEMRPNGGASLRDAVDRLDARSTEHDRRFGRIEHTLDGVAATLHRIEGRQTGDTGEQPVTE
jgi:hypothetical protein